MKPSSKNLRIEVFCSFLVELRTKKLLLKFTDLYCNKVPFLSNPTFLQRNKFASKTTEHVLVKLFIDVQKT